MGREWGKWQWCHHVRNLLFPQPRSQALSPLPRQRRERRESLGSRFLFLGNTKQLWRRTDNQFIRRYMFALKFILPVFCPATMFTHGVSFFSIRTEQSTRLAHQTKNTFYIRRLSKRFRQWQSIKKSLSNSNMACCWFSGLINFQEEIEKFKRQYIYKHILDTDARDHVYPLINKPRCYTAS